MTPTFNALGDMVLISKYYRRGRSIQVGDVVSFAHPIETDARAIKRVIGLAGDFVVRDMPVAVEGGELVGGRGVMVQVPEGHCWVEGDNLKYSRDSRMFGPLPLALVKGKVVVRFSPWWKPHWMVNPLNEAQDDDFGVD